MVSQIYLEKGNWAPRYFTLPIVRSKLKFLWTVHFVGVMVGRNRCEFVKSGVRVWSVLTECQE